MSACSWKDSKIVVFGGHDPYEETCSSTVAIITLKDLDSESIFFDSIVYSLSLLDPSAHWEKMVTPTELIRYHHSAHIYEEKMFVFGGFDQDEERKNDVWCLDLSISVLS